MRVAYSRRGRRVRSSIAIHLRDGDPVVAERVGRLDGAVLLSVVRDSPSSRTARSSDANRNRSCDFRRSHPADRASARRRSDTAMQAQQLDRP